MVFILNYQSLNVDSNYYQNNKIRGLFNTEGSVRLNNNKFFNTTCKMCYILWSKDTDYIAMNLLNIQHFVTSSNLIKIYESPT